jgi:hypothetical protein
MNKRPIRLLTTLHFQVNVLAVGNVGFREHTCTSKFRLPFAAADWLNCELETQTAKSYSG